MRGSASAMETSPVTVEGARSSPETGGSAAGGLRQRESLVRRGTTWQPALVKCASGRRWQTLRRIVGGRTHPEGDCLGVQDLLHDGEEAFAYQIQVDFFAQRRGEGFDRFGGRVVAQVEAQ